MYKIVFLECTGEISWYLVGKDDVYGVNSELRIFDEDGLPYNHYLERPLFQELRSAYSQDDLKNKINDENNQQTLFNSLLELSIDNFIYHGKEFNTIDLISEQDDWLDMESSCFDGKIWINGDFIEANDDNA